MTSHFPHLLLTVPLLFLIWFLSAPPPPTASHAVKEHLLMDKSQPLLLPVIILLSLSMEFNSADLGSLLYSLSSLGCKVNPGSFPNKEGSG